MRARAAPTLLLFLFIRLSGASGVPGEIDSPRKKGERTSGKKSGKRERDETSLPIYRHVPK
jgi:hypothetical protein